MTATTHDDLESFCGALHSRFVDEEVDHNVLVSAVERWRRTSVPDAVGLVSAGTGRTAGGAIVFPGRIVLTHMPRSHASALAEHVHRERPGVPRAHGPVPAIDAFAARRAALSGGVTQVAMRQRSYVLEAVIVPIGVSGSLRPAALGDAMTLAAWTEAFHDEADLRSPAIDGADVVAGLMADDRLFVWDDGGPRTMAAIMGLTANTVRISLVYTPPDMRRRGYASACVAALSDRCLRAGRRWCTLFTDADNPTSNRVYQRMGYVPRSDWALVVFDDDSPPR